jgi:hypothetical protein
VTRLFSHYYTSWGLEKTADLINIPVRIGKNMPVLFVDVRSIDVPRNWIVAFAASQKFSFLRIIALLGMCLLSRIHSQAWAFSRL